MRHYIIQIPTAEHVLSLFPHEILDFCYIRILIAGEVMH